MYNQTAIYLLYTFMAVPITNFSNLGPLTYTISVRWLNRGSNSLGDVWIGCKRLILKLSGVLLAMEVEGPYMHAK